MAYLAHFGEDTDFLDYVKRGPLEGLVHQQDTAIQKGLVIDSGM
jgi:hypothetical protein